MSKAEQKDVQRRQKAIERQFALGQKEVDRRRQEAQPRGEHETSRQAFPLQVECSDPRHAGRPYSGACHQMALLSRDLSMVPFPLSKEEYLSSLADLSCTAGVEQASRGSGY